MYLTNRDREIIEFVEKFNSITINQCGKIFYRGNKDIYYQARKRLHQLYEEGHLKRFRKDIRSESVYYLNKKLKKHDLLLLDVYSRLINIGADIKDFKREYKVKTNRKVYKIDGLIEFEYQDYWYAVIVEVDYTHYTSKRKLDDIFTSGHFQKRYESLGENIFPTVIIVRDMQPLVTDDTYKTIYCNYTLDILIKNLI